MAVRYENASLRIAGDAVEVRGKAYPLGEISGVEEIGFWGARAALVASLAMTIIVVGTMGGGALLYVFLASWGLLVLLLAYASFALKGLRLRTASGTRTLPGRFTRADRARIAAAIVDAQAARG